MRAPVLPTILPPPRRRSYGGLSVSVFLHALLIFLILSPWLRKYHLFSAEGSDLPGTGGGGGRGGEQYIALPALRPEAAPPKVVHVEVPVVPPPAVVPTVIPPPTPAPDSVVQPQTQAVTSDANGSAGGAAGTGGGGGGGNGGGQGPGTGGGAGPGTGGSERGRPPEQRQIVVPPLYGTPKELRGDSILVRFYVDATGVVDRIETDPRLPSGKFANDFNEQMHGFKFRPARDSLGIAVPGIAEVTITLSMH